MDLILALIEEYREKKKGDKNSKLTRFLPMLDERQRRMLVSMGLKYVKSEDVKTAYDEVHAERVAKFGPGVDEPFDRNEVPTLSYDAVAFLQGKLQADADEKALEAAVASLLGTKTGRIEFSKWDERVIKEIKQLFLVVDPSDVQGDQTPAGEQVQPARRHDRVHGGRAGDIGEDQPVGNVDGGSGKDFKVFEPDDRCEGA